MWKWMTWCPLGLAPFPGQPCALSLSSSSATQTVEAAGNNTTSSLSLLPSPPLPSRILTTNQQGQDSHSTWPDTLAYTIPRSQTRQHERRILRCARGKHKGALSAHGWVAHDCCFAWTVNTPAASDTCAQAHEHHLNDRQQQPKAKDKEKKIIGRSNDHRTHSAYIYRLLRRGPSPTFLRLRLPTKTHSCRRWLLHPHLDSRHQTLPPESPT